MIGRSGLLKLVAVAWGWPETRVWVIGADVGRSDPRAKGCHSVPRHMAAVSLDSGGSTRKMAMSRLARSSQGWPQRLEGGALFDTVSAAVEGLKDPSPSTARIVCGLTGTMTEADRPLLTSRPDHGP